MYVYSSCRCSSTRRSIESSNAMTEVQKESKEKAQRGLKRELGVSSVAERVAWVILFASGVLEDPVHCHLLPDRFKHRTDFNNITENKLYLV